jgi:hypothetical protein
VRAFFGPGKNISFFLKNTPSLSKKAQKRMCVEQLYFLFKKLAAHLFRSFLKKEKKNNKPASQMNIRRRIYIFFFHSFLLQKDYFVAEKILYIL